MGKPSRGIAYAYVDSLGQPKGMTATQWRNVKLLLRAICKHYPNACPSQERLVRLTHMSRSTVQRAIALAVQHDLLEVEYDAGMKTRHAVSATNRYHIVGLLTVHRGVNLTHQHGVNLKHKGTPDTYVSAIPPTNTEKEQAPSLQENDSAPVAPYRRKVIVPKKPLHEALAAASARGKIEPKKRAVPRQSSAWGTLAYFGEAWGRLVDERPELRVIRPLDSQKLSVNYLNAHFFAKAIVPRSTEWVHEQIDRWAALVLGGSIILVERESAFRNWTSWWGREGTEQAGVDPDEYFRSRG